MYNYIQICTQIPVERGSHVDWVIVMVIFSVPDNLLRVVEEEASKEHQAAVHVDSVEPREHCPTRCSKHAT